MSHQQARISRKDFLKSAALVGTSLALSRRTLAQSFAPSARPSTPYDLRDFVAWFTDSFEPSVKLPAGAGHYARSPGGPLELYGIADMACSLYCLGRLQPTEAERVQWADAFAQFQRASDGWLIEASPSHTPLHNLAFALGAMNLLDLLPRQPVVLGSEYDNTRKYIESLNWKTAVYTESHKGAGLGAIHALLPSLHSAQWFNEYFAIIDTLVDPNNGMLGQGKPPGGDFDQIGGTFHYFFLYNHFNRRMAYPEQRIDAILGLQRPDGHWDSSNQTWLTLDGIYLLTRSLRRCHHRPGDVEAAVRRTLDTLMDQMYSKEGRQRLTTGRLPTHSVNCALAIAAEAQQFLGIDQVITDWPLKLVLDRRPFI